MRPDGTRPVVLHLCLRLVIVGLPFTAVLIAGGRCRCVKVYLFMRLVGA